MPLLSSASGFTCGEFVGWPVFEHRDGLLPALGAIVHCAESDERCDGCAPGGSDLVCAGGPRLGCAALRVRAAYFAAWCCLCFGIWLLRCLVDMLAGSKVSKRSDSCFFVFGSCALRVLDLRWLSPCFPWGRSCDAGCWSGRRIFARERREEAFDRYRPLGFEAFERIGERRRCSS